MTYRDTPHHATGISPYQAEMNRPVRTKLDYTVPRKERRTGSTRRRWQMKVEAVKNTILLWEIMSC